MQKLQQSMMILRDPQHEAILAQIDALDRQNKKLISVADNILKTSFLQPVNQKPTIILQFQEDMRASFNALIDSIRQFFIGIDERMDRLATIVQAKFQEADLEKSKFAPYRQQGSDGEKIDMLISRMNSLENNLKKTQQNQSKLISIIESMANKRNPYDQQPTMVRSREKGFAMPTRQETPHQTSFRLFSVHGNSANSLETEYAMQNNYHMVNSQISQKQRPVQKQPAPYRFNNFCMPMQQDQKKVLGSGEAFLMNRKTFEMQNSNRIHRLSTLMKALKE